jgi:hypothetical protein
MAVISRWFFSVYLTGSIGSNYSLLYTLVIIYAAIFLGAGRFKFLRRPAVLRTGWCWTSNISA